MKEKKIQLYGGPLESRKLRLTNRKVHIKRLWQALSNMAETDASILFEVVDQCSESPVGIEVN